MNSLSPSVVDKIVFNCLQLFKKLPKTGKPLENEWTVLSCVIQHNPTNGNFEVISIGTGSKCIGASKMAPQGNILNDSHAEVMARRGFLSYLYDNINYALENQDSIFTLQDNALKLNENVVFLFYSSQLPCGDASIIPKSDGESFGEVLNVKRTMEDFETNDEVVACKNPKLECIKVESSVESVERLVTYIKGNSNNSENNTETKIIDTTTTLNQSPDIHRTGAKCLPNSEQDSKQPGADYHLLGKVRTKPGRGDRTLSVSCSDKIARWIHVGVQGALLYMLCGPIYIKHFIFGGGVPYSNEALNRALLTRDGSDLSSLRDYEPEFYQSTIQFHCLKSNQRTRPAAGSIVWVKTHTSDVSVQGIKLGVTKKTPKSPNNYLFISKYKLFQKFLNTIRRHKEYFPKIATDDIKTVKYNEFKRKSDRYQEKWRTVKDIFFKTWTLKPDLWNFIVD